MGPVHRIFQIIAGKAALTPHPDRSRDAPGSELGDAERTRQMVSRVAYLRLRRLAARWEHEERVKPLIVREALLWLAGLLAGAVALAWMGGLSPAGAIAVAMGAWVVRVLALASRHLRESPARLSDDADGASVRRLPPQ